MGLPRTPGDSPTKSEFVGHGTVSPSKSSSRKARNATPRQHDIEFAADIGQGLLEEVRKLQALLAQRDQKLSEATASIARSDRQLELCDRKVKQMHEDQGSSMINCTNRRIFERGELEYASAWSGNSKPAQRCHGRCVEIHNREYSSSSADNFPHNSCRESQDKKC